MRWPNGFTGKVHSFGGKEIELEPNAKLRSSDAFDDANAPGQIMTTSR